jgi:hypothetical protein
VTYPDPLGGSALDHVALDDKIGMEVGEGVRFDHHVANVGENGAVAADVFEGVP